jgi:transposase InsO family protein
VACHGKPDVFNTDQGSQFTGSAFTGVLANNGIAISIDGKGAWRDNVFVERLWRRSVGDQNGLRRSATSGRNYVEVPHNIINRIIVLLLQPHQPGVAATPIIAQPLF